MEKNITVLCELDLARAANKPTKYVNTGWSRVLHLHGSLGSEVGLEDLMETLGRVDVDGKCLCLSDDVCLGVDEL